MLLDKGSNVSAEGDLFGSPAGAAAYNGRISVLRLVLAQPSSKTSLDSFDRAPLAWAAIGGRLHLIQSLWPSWPTKAVMKSENCPDLWSLSPESRDKSLKARNLS